jgi:hypothetical protein
MKYLGRDVAEWKQWIRRYGFVFLDSRLSKEEKESRLRKIESFGFIRTDHRQSTLNDRVFFVKEKK